MLRCIGQGFFEPQPQKIEAAELVNARICCVLYMGYEFWSNEMNQVNHQRSLEPYQAHDTQ